MSEPIEVVLDLTRCQGYANCVVAAPEIFDIDETTGVAILLSPRPAADQRAAAEDAVSQCPTEAISIAGP